MRGKSSIGSNHTNPERNAKKNYIRKVEELKITLFTIKQVYGILPDTGRFEWIIGWKFKFSIVIPTFIANQQKIHIYTVKHVNFQNKAK